MPRFDITKQELRILHKDPEQFAYNLTPAELEQLLLEVTEQYTNEGNSPVSDAEFDTMFDVLREVRPKSKLFKQGVAPPRTSLKEKLPLPMFTLDKVKMVNVDDWLQGNPGPYNLSDKLDGVSLEIQYDNYVPISIHTRGTYYDGSNVSHLIPRLDIPKRISVRRLTVRGECMIALSDFKSEWSSKYKNPRNLVAGAIAKTTKYHEALGSIKFIVHELMSPRQAPSKALASLKGLGFKVVANTTVPSLTSTKLLKLLEARKTRSSYDIDGLVITLDKPTPLSMDGPPKYAVAFKHTFADAIVEAPVTKVEWSPSQFGRLIPVVHIKPVTLAGVTVSKCSGGTAFFIINGYRYGSKHTGKAMPIGKGAIVKVTRSGDVIPHIIEVVKAAPIPDLPDVDYTVSKNGVDLILIKGTGKVRNALDQEILVKKLTAFFSVVGIDFVKQGVVDKLVSHGFDSIPKILRASVKDFQKIDGFQETLARKVWSTIHEKTDSPIPLSTLMKASSVFDRGIGLTKLNDILRQLPDVMRIYKKYGITGTIAEVKQLAGFQDKTARTFAEGLPAFDQWLTDTGLSVKTTKTTLDGQTIAFTGFRDKELEKRIWENQGRVAGVSAKTTILLVKDKNHVSKKVEQAVKQGVVIMTPNTFESKYLR